ncbi:MAG: hypothetical protein E7287_00330 [Lachnospiraceae bacterium]|nr:hypothetical protein [Lachnospiraceae bacterium]
MKRILKRFMEIALICCLMCVVVPSIRSMAADKAGTYHTMDMFKSTNNKKGLQGAGTASLYGGIKHTMGNLVLNDVIYEQNAGYGIAYEYEGETFYFSYDPLGSASGAIHAASRENMSVSVVFLLRYSDADAFLIDENSRVAGHTYYAPNTNMDTYGGRAIRAYWHYLMNYLINNNLHIDNFILGNEVNMPNHWHYSGSLDPTTVANKYADAFYVMYSAVREYSDIPRCSISIDHSWQHNDEGRGIMAKTFLNLFHSRLSAYGSDIDWCVSAHLYPAVLFETDLWNGSTLVKYDLSPYHTGAQFVDGSNLWVMTNYIRDTFGEHHRVMLTEQGFTNYKGDAAQTACLAYTYYAALYDPMVDCFLLVTGDHGDKLNFNLNSVAAEVYTKIGNGNADDEKWIADVCLPTIRVSSWAAIIPNYGILPDIDKSLNGLAESKDGGWYYYKYGLVDTEFTGFVENESGRWYIQEGVLDFTYTGLVPDEEGWWMVVNGGVDYNYKGLAFANDKWWYIQNGKIDFNYCGPCEYNGATWIVINGEVDFVSDGLVCTGLDWYLVKGGLVRTDYTGLAFINDAWWYVVAGKIDFAYCGLMFFNNDWWYVQGGMIDFTYNNVYYFNDTWYYIETGKVNRGYNGLAYTEFNDKWWYVINGVISFDYTGSAYANDKYWYVERGEIYFSRFGKVTIDGVEKDVAWGEILM